MNTADTSFSSTPTRPIPLMGEIEGLVKRMRELEEQNGEFYRQQQLQNYEDTVLAKYLAETNKQQQQQTKVLMELISFLPVDEDGRNIPVEVCRDQLGAIMKKLEKLSTVGKEDVLKVLDKTVELLIEYLDAWVTGIIRGQESDYEKRHMVRVSNVVQALRDIQRLSRTEVAVVETSRRSRTDSPRPASSFRDVHDWLQNASPFSDQQRPHILRQGVPNRSLAGTPAPSMSQYALGEHQRSEALKRENAELKDTIEQMEKDVRLLKEELSAIKQIQTVNERDLRVSIRKCSKTCDKITQIESGDFSFDNKLQDELKKKEAEIIELEKKNCELFNSQVEFQRAFKDLQNEIKKKHDQELEEKDDEILSLKRRNAELVKNQENVQRSYNDLLVEVELLNLTQQKLEQKDVEILSLKKKNSELLESQERLQSKYEALQIQKKSEVKALENHNDYLMTAVSSLEEKNRKLDGRLNELEELEKTFKDSKKIVIELKNELGAVKKLLNLREKEIEKLTKSSADAKKSIADAYKSISTNPFLGMKDEAGPIESIFLKQLLDERAEFETKLMEKNLNIELLNGIIRDMKAREMD